jgi:hypothetical protein
MEDVVMETPNLEDVLRRSLEGLAASWPVLTSDRKRLVRAAAAELAALRAENKALLELMPHLRHAYNNENGEGCAHYIYRREACTCGLDSALSALSALDGEVPRADR